MNGVAAHAPNSQEIEAHAHAVGEDNNRSFSGLLEKSEVIEKTAEDFIDIITKLDARWSHLAVSFVGCHIERGMDLRVRNQLGG